MFSLRVIMLRRMEKRAIRGFISVDRFVWGWITPHILPIHQININDLFITNKIIQMRTYSLCVLQHKIRNSLTKKDDWFHRSFSISRLGDACLYKPLQM
jgi:hypothetical protein